MTLVNLATDQWLSMLVDQVYIFVHLYFYHYYLLMSCPSTRGLSPRAVPRDFCSYRTGQWLSICADEAIKVCTDIEVSVGPCLTQQNAD